MNHYKSRKYLWIISVVLFFTILICTPVTANIYFQLVQVDYPVVIDGTNLQMDLPLLNYQGNTYMPLRKVSEATKTYIVWDSVNKKIEISTGNSLSYRAYQYFYLMLYFDELKEEIINEFVVANNQFHMHLGLLISPGDTGTLSVATLQSYRREAKTSMKLNYFTSENFYYTYILNNCGAYWYYKILDIEEYVMDGLDYYIDAANNRGFYNNPQDYIALHTPFWNLKGKGNEKLTDALVEIGYCYSILKNQIGITE